MLSLIVTTLDLADEEELSRFTRLYGGSIQRLVTAGLQFFDRAVRQRVESYDLPPEERNSVTYRRRADTPRSLRRSCPGCSGATASTPSSNTSSA